MVIFGLVDVFFKGRSSGASSKWRASLVKLITYLGDLEPWLLWVRTRCTDDVLPGVPLSVIYTHGRFPGKGEMVFTRGAPLAAYPSCRLASSKHWLG